MTGVTTDPTWEWLRQAGALLSPMGEVWRWPDQDQQLPGCFAPLNMRSQHMVQNGCQAPAIASVLEPTGGVRGEGGVLHPSHGQSHGHALPQEGLGSVITFSTEGEGPWGSQLSLPQARGPQMPR